MNYKINNIEIYTLDNVILIIVNSNNKFFITTYSNKRSIDLINKIINTWKYIYINKENICTVYSYNKSYKYKKTKVNFREITQEELIEMLI